MRGKIDGIRRSSLALFLLSLWLVCGGAGGAQKSKRSDGVQLISVGEITRIDARQRSFELKSELESSADPGAGGWSSGIHGSVWIGIGRGRSSGIEGGRVGSRPSEPMEPSLAGEGQPEQSVTTKVSTTDRTVFKEGEQPIAFADLKIGNTVRVKGVPQGKEIRATEVWRASSMDLER
ncbi:MAG: hypothetical protein HYX74_02020 [Acidobacteria bacterium]|nr:hypothetical protein [Acidobacteriota bacterium]